MNIIHAHWQPPTSPEQLERVLIWTEFSHAASAPAKIDRRRKLHPHPFAGLELPVAVDAFLDQTEADSTGVKDWTAARC